MYVTARQNWFSHVQARLLAFFVATVSLTACLTVLLSPLSVSAQNPLDNACTGTGAASPVCQESGEDPLVGDQGIITKVATILANVTGIIAVIVIVIAGLTMTLSSGNSSTVQSSRDAIIYAAVALAVAVLARAIIAFVIGNLT